MSTVATGALFCAVFCARARIFRATPKYTIIAFCRISCPPTVHTHPPAPFPFPPPPPSHPAPILSSLPRTQSTRYSPFSLSFSLSFSFSFSLPSPFPSRPSPPSPRPHSVPSLISYFLISFSALFLVVFSTSPFLYHLFSVVPSLTLFCFHIFSSLAVFFSSLSFIPCHSLCTSYLLFFLVPIFSHPFSHSSILPFEYHFECRWKETILKVVTAMLPHLI